jgi:tRNA(fMet)-specific endonuclease VapC
VSLRYMLDTDSVSFVLRGQGHVAARMAEHRPSQLCISSLTLAELRHGAEKRRSAMINGLIDAFTGTIAVVAFDSAAANRFGLISARLGEAGTPIGHLDTLIASHALALGLTLVTNNTKHFGRVKGLRVANWA